MSTVASARLSQLVGIESGTSTYDAVNTQKLTTLSMIIDWLGLPRAGAIVGILLLMMIS